MQERTTQAGGLKIRYLEEGQGQPMVLLHGASLGSSSDGFARNMGPLARGGLRAIAPDRPGFGFSDGPVIASAAGHRKFILDFLDALGIERAILVGHSQQGGVSAQLALEHPDRVPKALILGGGAVLPPSASGGDAEGEGERLTAEPSLEWTAEQLKGNLYNHALITPEAVEVRNRMSRGSAFKNYLERSGGGRPPAGGPASTEEPLWKRVGANPDRFFLMFGRQDKPTTAEQCELFLKQYPTYPLMLLDGCSHMVHWDYAEEFERQAIAFAKASPVAA
jgi:pimeloyl-ACP methyl ester carboxylesterase